MIIELEGLEVLGRHGVLDEERREEQLFLVDVALEVGARGESDRIDDAVDYRQVAVCVQEVSDGQQFHLLEAFASALADALLERFAPESVRVRVRKPAVREWGVPAEFAAATVERGSR